MLKKVQNNIYQLNMNMPETRVKSINEISVYIVKGEEGGRNLLVDTGINQQSNLGPILEAYEKIGIKQEDTDVFVTHMHSDHSGLLCKLQNSSNSIIAHEREAALINGMNDETYWEFLYYKYLEEGLPMEYREYRDSHPDGENYCEGGVDFVCVQEGDILEYGGYSFKCVITPGHSPAHTCLYDEATKTMLSGDSVLADVIPILFIEPDFYDPLNDYLEGLKKIGTLEIEHFLAAHSNINFDVYKRMDEIVQHYDHQFEWIIDQLKEHGKMNGWELGNLLIQRDLKREIGTVSAVSRWFFFLPACLSARYMAGKGMIKYTVDEKGVKYYEAL